MSVGASARRSQANLHVYLLQRYLSQISTPRPGMKSSSSEPLSVLTHSGAESFRAVTTATSSEAVRQRAFAPPASALIHALHELVAPPSMSLKMGMSTVSKSPPEESASASSSAGASLLLEAASPCGVVGIKNPTGSQPGAKFR